MAEVFYGLTRAQWHTDVLSNKSKLIIYASIVILPYIQKKIENVIETYRNEIDYKPETCSNIRLKQNIIRVYRIVATVYECSQVFQYVAYMANLSKSHSILLRLLRLNLDYLPPDENSEWTWSDFFTGKIKYKYELR